MTRHDPWRSRFRCSVTVNDQFASASTTKGLVAAQVMQLVEAGELRLDDLAADHLPSDLDFDTNGATIRHLLGHRSGIPDYLPTVDPQLIADPLRFWTPAELLAEVPADRTTAGEAFEYGNTNYVLLGLVIEEVRGRPIATVLRDGVLGIDGVDRLIYQPDETPTEPMAMPNGVSTDALETGGGFLPSLALTSDGPAASMASDAPSLARWWRAFCAGHIVSQMSMTEMMMMQDGYGLGLHEPDPPGTVGHGGEHVDTRLWRDACRTMASSSWCWPIEAQMPSTSAQWPVRWLRRSAAGDALPGCGRRKTCAPRGEFYALRTRKPSGRAWRRPGLGA